VTATLDWAEYAARAFEPTAEPQWPTPGDLAAYLDYRTVHTPALRLLDRNLTDVAGRRTQRLLWTMSPQEGKSQRIARTFPLWLLLQNPEARIGIASYELGVARRWGRAIRNDIKAHPELGLRVRDDTAAAHEWQLDGHDGSVYCVGIGGALTGRPIDGVLIIDDPVKGRAEADSETYRQIAVDWWSETASTRLAPGTPVVMDMTRWHEADLGGHMLTHHRSEWTYVNIPALADHDPNKGETDPLGREPGEWMLSARGRDAANWEQRRRDAGARGWAALYQGRPAPAEGTLFKRGDWQYYSPALVHTGSDGCCRAESMDEVVQSWDMAFKDTKGSDYVVGQVWGRRGADVFLLDQVRDRLDFPATCRAVEALTAKWPQAAGKFVEDKANGPAVIAQLRARVPGLIPVTPKDSKFARASAVAPFVEAHNVHLPNAAAMPWVGTFVEEHASFPNAAHDDQVDAMSQALSRLLGDQGSANAAMEWLRGFAAA
jgi:predicted phage terminase large subunit-like protein